MSFRLSKFLICLILLGESLHASPPARLKFDPDSWVRAKVDALVVAACAAYKDDKAIPAYERVLNSIVSAMRRRKLSQDVGFSSRYREFVEYIEAVSLDQQPWS